MTSFDQTFSHPPSVLTMTTPDILPDDEFFRLNHVVDSVCFSRDAPPVQWVPALRAEDTKHLKMLDGIALLLVRTRNGDVAAASYRLKRNGVDLFLAKDAPLDADERRYVGEIIAIVRELGISAADRRRTTADILKRALGFCADKFARRHAKLVSGLEERGWSPEKLRLAADGQLELWPGPWNEKTALGRKLVAHRLLRSATDMVDGRRVGVLLGNFTKEDDLKDEKHKYDLARMAYVLGKCYISFSCTVRPTTDSNPNFRYPFITTY
jgi:hypothetical protein